MLTFADFGTFVLASGLTTAAVVKFFGGITDKLIAAKIDDKFDKQLETLKAEFTRINEQRKIEYGWLYVERARAMLEIYKELVSTETARSTANEAVLRTVGTPTPEQETREEAEQKISAYFESLRTLKDSFECRRLLFSEEADNELSERIDALLDGNEHRLHDLRQLLDQRDQRPHDDTSLKEAEQRNDDYYEAKRLLEKNFRQLYGSVLTTPSSPPVSVPSR